MKQCQRRQRFTSQLTSLEEASEVKEEIKVQGKHCFSEVSIMYGWSALHYAVRNLVPVHMSFCYVCYTSCLLQTLEGTLHGDFCSLRFKTVKKEDAVTVLIVCEEGVCQRKAYFTLLQDLTRFILPLLSETYESPLLENCLKLNTNHRYNVNTVLPVLTP